MSAAPRSRSAPLSTRSCPATATGGQAMRSRSWSELLPVALAAAVEGIWVGALAAAISGASGPALMAFVAVVVFVAALLARRVAGGAAAGEGSDRAAVAEGSSG